MRKIINTSLLLFIFCLFSAFLAAKVFVPQAQMQSAETVSETFEDGKKTAYTAGNIVLRSGSWSMNDALLGNTASDRKTGKYSARVRNTGVVSMNFNAASAGTVSVRTAVYGNDGASSWELWQSTNNGLTWTKNGATQTTISTALSTKKFTVNYQSAIRFQIRKVSGGTNRLNFDNVRISSYTVSPTPTPVLSPTPSPNPTPSPSTNEHLTLGNPSNAANNAFFASNYLMEKPQYALSYHRDRGAPNWISWHLDRAWLGQAARQDDFRNDASLPADWYQVQGTDYSGSGYDRGHMCPSADRTNSTASNSATFLMTNIIPQSPDNNQGPWAVLENYTRSLVTSGSEAYIISGGYGNSGTIANGKVVVPSATWKVILVLPNGTNDVARVSTASRTIAVWMPNQQGIRNNTWQSYRVSVDYVEQMTGYDFFSNVPAGIQSTIEARVDNQ